MKHLTTLLKRLSATPLGATVVNLLMAYVVYSTLRIVYILENWSAFSDGLSTAADWWAVCIRGGLLFDTSAIAYTLAPWLLMMLLPLHLKEHRGYYRVARWVYLVPLWTGVVINLADAVFYPYRFSRSTMMVFDEFKEETGSLFSIVAPEVLSHWYLVIVAAVIIYATLKLYRRVDVAAERQRSRVAYYATYSVALVAAGVLTVCGMRGAWLWDSTRPISVNEAFRYCRTVEQPAIVLNTTFSLVRTVGQGPPAIPQFFEDEAVMATYFNPVVAPVDPAADHPKAAATPNIVVIIVEGLTSEFVGTPESGNEYGCMPFVDSLRNNSLTWEHTFSNTGFSIDAMPAILASIPRMQKPFVVSPYSVHPINSIASCLKPLGYSSAFFHGAINQSLGLSAFGRQAGFDAHYGREEYDADSRTAGEADYDGTWGIWDEEFLQYFALKLDEQPQPFVAGVFTLSSHHPFAVPEKYRDRFVDRPGEEPVNKCFRYVDHALRRFFDTASRMPWYDNTIFVITADHTSPKSSGAEYKTSLGKFRVPIILFNPSGEMPRGVMEGIAQQTDIMPTLLHYVGVNQPFVAFGCDLFATPPAERWAFNFDALPQIIQGDYMMQLSVDGTEVKGVWNYRTDPLLTTDLSGTLGADEELMLNRAHAIIQTYITLGNNRKFTLENP